MGEQKLKYEDAITELTSIVEQLEQGDVSLEQALQQFERGVTLTRQCQQQLQAAEQKIQMLSQTTDELEPYQENPES